MAEATRTIPYDEFANNVSDFFNLVAHDNETIVVEKDTGESIVLEPAKTTRHRKRKRTKADHEAFLSAAGGWSDVDVDSFLKDVYESRKSSRPPVKL